jgi:hypothetical protein
MTPLVEECAGISSQIERNVSGSYERIDSATVNCFCDFQSHSTPSWRSQLLASKFGSSSLMSKISLFLQSRNLNPTFKTKMRFAKMFQRGLLCNSIEYHTHQDGVC